MVLKKAQGLRNSVGLGAMANNGYSKLFKIPEQKPHNAI